MQIINADTADYPLIFALHQRAFRGEAQTYYANREIRPLRQTLADFIKEARRGVLLKAELDGGIVGAINIRLEDRTCYIGGVVVEPERQNQGIGARLMQAAEAYFPGAERCELFTGEKSERNLHFYEKLGYRPFKTAPEDPYVNLVFLEKQIDLRPEPQSVANGDAV